MDTDGYTPTIDFEKLLQLARKYGPEALAGERLPTNGQATDEIQQVTCPCVQGDVCVSEALAKEFERLAEVFRQQVRDLKPKSCPDCESRWDDEGGLAVTTTPPPEVPRLQ